jgi:CheY-like chemotaxis protein
VTRVLVIDDEKNLADTLVLILQGAGFHATAAYNGDSALQRLDAVSPDIVISDVIMPGINGVEVCAQIQLRYPNCQILLFSGQAATNEVINQARAQGFSWELLAKPIEPEDLIAKLSSLTQRGESAGM